MATPKGAAFLSGVSIERLVSLYNNEANPKAKIRLQCAILRKKGKNQSEISDATNWPIQTVSDTLIRFEERGLDGCYAIKQKGRPPKLTKKQKKKLEKVLQESPIKAGIPFAVWTSKLVRYVIKKMFGIKYVMRQVYNLMKELKFSIQRPRPEHLLASKELQRKFKKNLDEELKNLSKQDMRSSFWTKPSSH